MIELQVDSKRNLNFIKRDRILQGEHKFDRIKIKLPNSINNFNVENLTIKVFFVNGKEYISRQIIPEDYTEENENVVKVLYTDIDYTLTQNAKRWLVYVTFYNIISEEEIEIGKTNAVAISVNQTPYNDQYKLESKGPDIILYKGDKGDTGEQGAKGDKGATGADGYSPTATVTQTATGATITITDANGTTTANVSNGTDGNDYILTNQDKSDIANIVLGLLPTTQGVQYGNQSN